MALRDHFPWHKLMQGESEPVPEPNLDAGDVIGLLVTGGSLFGLVAVTVYFCFT